MANSRQLVDCMVALTGLPQSRVLGCQRDLREAAEGTVAAGRGRSAPQMTPRDAAALYCALYAAPAVQESAATIVGLEKLDARLRTQKRRSGAQYVSHPNYERPFSLNLPDRHTVIDGLAALVEFFMREHELPRAFSERHGPGRWGIYASFEVRSPEFSAAMVVGVHNRFAERWTYGRKQLDSVRIGRCSEVSLRKLADCLRSPR
jgi:hypothetical protein